MVEFRKLPAGGLVVLIGLYLGLLCGGFAWCVNRLAQRSILLACVGAPFLWVTLEFVREHFPEISFPWGLLGYPPSSNLGLLQITTLTGIYGLSFFAAAVNAIFAWCDASTETPVRTRVTVLVSTLVLLTRHRAHRATIGAQRYANHYARAVQLNFPEVNDFPANWYPLHAEDLNEIEQLSLEPSSKNPDLLIWPETPAPFSFEDARFLNRASQLGQKFGHPFLAGSIEWRPLAPRGQQMISHTLVPYNSAVLVDAKGRNVFTYDKIHLVPFGEYEPFPLIHRVVKSVSSEIGGFAKGTKFGVANLPMVTPFHRLFATKRSIPARFAISPPKARNYSSIFPTMAGSGARPRRSSTCA